MKKTLAVLLLLILLLWAGAVAEGGTLTLPENTTTIGAECFAGCACTRIVIPNSVTSIGDDAIPEGTTIACKVGAYAATWAREHGYTIEYLDKIDVESVSFDAASFAVDQGDFILLCPQILPANASFPEVTWATSDATIATVDEVGRVDGVGAGTCTITVTTTDGGLTASCEVVVTENPVVYRALLIGNNYVDDAAVNPTLAGPINDANAMASMLSTMDATPYTSSVYTEQSAPEILTNISRLATEPDSNDVTLFFFAGHGGGSGSLVGYGGALITPSTLRKSLDQIPGKKIVIIDACYCGTIIGRSANGDASSDDTRNFAESFLSSFVGFTSRNGGLVGGNYYVICSCSGSEVSWEASGYGLFTRFLTRSCGWDEPNDCRLTEMWGDTDSNGSVTVEEAYAYAKQKVQAFLENAGYVQTVVMYAIESGQVIGTRTAS